MSNFWLTARLRGRFWTVRCLVLTSIILLLLFKLLHSSLPGDTSLYGAEYDMSDSDIRMGKPPHENEHFDGICGAPFEGSQRIVVTVKTGNTEASKKIPTLMQTSLLCAPHVMVFSDMAQKLGDIQIFDALEPIASSVTDGNSDFDIYRKQQEIQDPMEAARLLRDMQDPARPGDLAAWTLDKYKNLHIIEAAWAFQPDMDWYVHIDADTYVVWPSLLAWLERLDSSKESFLGSLSYIVGRPFAHGGSGMILSKAAMHNFVVAHNGTAARLDPELHDNCCGDWFLAQVLKEYGMDVMNAWPTINGETPSTVPFASDHWCQPLVTMHHISPAEAQVLGKFEEQRYNKSEPLLYSELFKDMISGSIPDQREDWDNMAKDESVEDIHSADDCRKACADEPKCFQSLYNGGECSLGTSSIILGVTRASDDGKNGRVVGTKPELPSGLRHNRPVAGSYFLLRSEWQSI